MLGSSAEDESFSKATCLTPQGFEEAKAIGVIFKIAKVEVSQVWSSPSCRARQTSSGAFGRISDLDNSLLHRSAMPKHQWVAFDNRLRELILSLPQVSGSNHVLVGHGSTLGIEGNKIVDSNEFRGDLDERDETGFVVLMVKDSRIVAKHSFRSIRYFAQVALSLPLGE